jgi:hypothetical protein
MPPPAGSRTPPHARFWAGRPAGKKIPVSPSHRADFLGGCSLTTELNVLWYQKKLKIAVGEIALACYGYHNPGYVGLCIACGVCASMHVRDVRGNRKLACYDNREFDRLRVLQRRTVCKPRFLSPMCVLEDNEREREASMALYCLWIHTCSYFAIFCFIKLR